MAWVHNPQSHTEKREGFFLCSSNWRGSSSSLFPMCEKLISEFSIAREAWQVSWHTLLLILGFVRVIVVYGQTTTRKPENQTLKLRAFDPFLRILNPASKARCRIWCFKRIVSKFYIFKVYVYQNIMNLTRDKRVTKWSSSVNYNWRSWQKS